MAAWKHQLSPSDFQEIQLEQRHQTAPEHLQLNLAKPNKTQAKSIDSQVFWLYGNQTKTPFLGGPEEA